MFLANHQLLSLSWPMLSLVPNGGGVINIPIAKTRRQQGVQEAVSIDDLGGLSAS